MEYSPERPPLKPIRLNTPCSIKQKPSTAAHSTSEEWVIRSHKSLLCFDWQELWQYKDLLMLLVRRDFLAKYQQTILGPIWFLLQPLLMTLVFSVVFGKIARISTAGVPAILFYLNGLMGWNYFAQTFSLCASTFVTHSDVFQKVYFPRLVVPLSSLISNLFAFVVQLALFLSFYFYFWMTGEGPTGVNWTWLLLPFFILHLGLLGLSCALFSSALTARFRDLNYLIPLIIQLWMYATPIIYPLSTVPEEYKIWMTINPVSAPIEGIRHIFLGVGKIHFEDYALSLVMSSFLGIISLILFKHAERHATDTA